MNKRVMIGVVAAFATMWVGACAGDTGPMGSAGVDGVDGIDGSDGMGGAPGVDGNDGTNGTMGVQGDPGEPGPDGPTWQVIPPWLRGEYEANARKWWEWSASLPDDGTHPLDYATPGDCNMGQSGSVFFLGGSFGGDFVPAGCDPSSTCTGTTATVTRDCAIPANKALFIPLANVIYNNVDEDPVLTHQELVENARNLGTAATGLSVSIDGMDLANISDYHVQSTGVYELAYAAGAPISGSDGSAGFTQAAEDSYYVMLSPLPAGTHTIHFTGGLHFTSAEHGFDWTFDLDVTYNITVAAP